jgi:uncharacterized protein (DUF934 family)
MALYRHGRIVTNDDWIFVQPGEQVPAHGHVALRRDAWLASRAALAGRAPAIGLVLASDESLAPILSDLPYLGLIALEFPRFTDGRAYSLARMLRQTHGYGGELRARGDVLRDQIKLLLRAGFDALELADPDTIAALRDGRIVSVSRHYQTAATAPSSSRPYERSDGIFGWRRQSDPIPPAGSGGFLTG